MPPQRHEPARHRTLHPAPQFAPSALVPKPRRRVIPQGGNSPSVRWRPAAEPGQPIIRQLPRVLNRKFTCRVKLRKQITE